MFPIFCRCLNWLLDCQFYLFLYIFLSIIYLLLMPINSQIVVFLCFLPFVPFFSVWLFVLLAFEFLLISPFLFSFHFSFMPVCVFCPFVLVHFALLPVCHFCYFCLFVTLSFCLFCLFRFFPFFPFSFYVIFLQFCVFYFVGSKINTLKLWSKNEVMIKFFHSLFIVLLLFCSRLFEYEDNSIILIQSVFF